MDTSKPNNFIKIGLYAILGINKLVGYLAYWKSVCVQSKRNGFKSHGIR